VSSDLLFDEAGRTGTVRTFETHSDEETRELGRQLAAALPQHAVVALIGDLGAGKTTLVQGIVHGRRAAEQADVSSPTFSLIHEYGDPVSVYHIDLYRLESAEEARRLGLEDIFSQDALVLVEWADCFPDLFPPGTIFIRLRAENDSERAISVEIPAPLR
jgi:tRNA threonylcarbamoyladenosine biosynthesis protein TsaE